MREKIAEKVGRCLECWDTCATAEDCGTCYAIADQILSLFKEQIEKMEVLSDEEIEEVYQQAYKKACEFSEEYSSGLSSEHWLPTRQGDRKRYFNEQHREDIQEATSQAQLAKDKDVLRGCE